MMRHCILLLLLAALLAIGCGGKQPSPTGSTAPPSSNQATPSPDASGPTGVTTVAGASGTGGAGGGATGGTVGGASVAGTGAGSSPASQPLSRAEAEQNYERLRKEFPQETSVNQSPSEARAAAKARTIESTEGMNGYDIVSEKIQPSRSLESEMAGKKLFVAMCRRCHAEDGSPVDQNAALARYNMANLSDPMQYKYGADGRGIFRSIAFGTKAPPHGTYNGILSDEQIWNIVAYVQSIQKSP